MTKRYRGMEAAERFCTLLDGGLDNDQACWRTFPDSEEGKGANYQGAFPLVKNTLWHEQESGHGVFRVINAGGQKGSLIHTTIAWFVDSEGQELPENWHLPPSFICQRDKTHFHAYWVAEFDTGTEEFTNTQKQLAAYYGTDPSVCDLSRVMRVPGFKHHKLERNGAGYDLLDPGERRIYSLEQIQEGLPEIPDSPASGAGLEYVEGANDSEHMRRAHLYLRKVPPAIDNQTAEREGLEPTNGRQHTLATCHQLAEFGLDADGILEVLGRPDALHGTSWLDRCRVPWCSDDEELEKIIEGAVSKVLENGNWGRKVFYNIDDDDIPEDVADDDEPLEQKSTRPVIRVKTSALVTNQLCLDNAIREKGTDIFERGGAVVSVKRIVETETKDGVRRPVGAHVIELCRHDVMTYFAMEAAGWVKWNERVKALVGTKPPSDVISGYLNNSRVRSLRPLHAIAQAPTIRPDGSIVQSEGYDERSGLYVQLRSNFPTVPESPSREGAKEALAKLRHVVRGVVFDGQESIEDDTLTPDEAVWLALAITGVIRSAIPTAPLFGISAPTKGSGKTLLADLAGIIATGGDVPAMSIPDSEEELRKTLFSSLLAGDEMVLLDNIGAGVMLESDALNAILTKTTYEGRVLGASQIITVPVATTFVATGNNLGIKGDLKRRTLLCYTDPRCEEPDKRRYSWNARTETKERRPELVAAVLTIVRAYLAAGAPDQEIEPYGSFEDWSHFVRAPLVWLGVPDPCETRKKVDDGDDEGWAEKQFIKSWVGLIGKRAVTVKDVVLEATRSYPDDPETEERAGELREALDLIAPGKPGPYADKFNKHALGYWLKSRTNRTIAGYQVRADGITGGARRWKMIRVH